MLNNTFGNLSTDASYTRVDVDSTDESNQVITGGGNGTAGSNTVAWHFDGPITDAAGKYKFVVQYDFK